jgi:16S rRNA (cytidine1402-2'-O)-methyltransferase
MNIKKPETLEDIEPSILYVVATPIGNLGDITQRALAVLGGVNVIAAEDTRHTRLLLEHFNLHTELVSLHEQNEERRCKSLVTRLEKGEAMALVSDAGTPLISDPGYRLVRAVHAAGLSVRAIPGASAVTAALSICGLPTNRFTFEGFLPVRAAARRSRLANLVREERTMVFFESPRRLLSTLTDMRVLFGEERQITLVREISKKFEAVLRGAVAELQEQVRLDDNLQRGELVIVVDGDHKSEPQYLINPLELMTFLGEHLPHREASVTAARITGGRANDFYRLFLEHLKNNIS